MPGFIINGLGDPARNPPNTVETGRRHRYLLTILNPLKDVLIYAHKVTRPTFEVDIITVHSGQDLIYRPGKHKWNPIELTIYDVVTGGEHLLQEDDTAASIYNWWRNSMIDTSNSKQYKPKDYRENCVLEMHDGLGDPIWTYELYGCWPSKVSPSDLQYSETAIADITVTLQVDRVVEK
jgi:hypothetical protein